MPLLIGLFEVPNSISKFVWNVWVLHAEMFEQTLKYLNVLYYLSRLRCHKYLLSFLVENADPFILHIVNIVAAYDYVTQGARSSAVTALT